MWTDDQIKAINHEHSGMKKSSAIVSAAAGSGKTAVLVERVIQIISDQEKAIPANSLAVVTFTNKAASELKMRLNSALKAMIKEEKSEYLREQQLLLNEAKISTINSFCINIIRENVNLLDISPDFTILGEEETGTLMQDSINKALDYFYDNCTVSEQKELFNNFVIKNDKKIEEIILQIHNFLSNIPNKNNWINQQKNKFINSSNYYDYYFNILKEVLISMLNSVINYNKKATNELQKLPIDMPHREKLFNIINDDYGKIIKIIDMIKTKDNDLIADELSKFKLDKFPSCRFDKYDKREEYTQFKDDIKSIRDNYIGKTKKINEYIFIKSDHIEDCNLQINIINILFNIYEKFSEIFSEIKRQKNVIDFSDSEQFTYEILNDNGKPSEVAKRLSKDLSMIIVDEFQDSNDLQYEIFRLLSNDEKNLYFVGDVKQSIYGFRGANPNVFINLCDNDEYQLLPLNKNFRSRQEVVNAVNMVFLSIMTKESGGVDYKNSRLVYGANFPMQRNATEFYILDGDTDNKTNHFSDEDDDESDFDDLTVIENQAKFVANRINEMLESGFMVNSKEGMRKAVPSDFCVLLRDKIGNAEHFADYLREFGIVVNSSGIKNYLALFEINLIMDFLTIIDNPLKSVEFLSVLMSPIYLFSAEILTAIRIGATNLDIHELEKVVDMTKFYSKFKKASLYSCVLKCSKPFTIKEIENDEFYKDCFSDDEKSKLKQLYKNNPNAFRRDGNELCKEFINDFKELRSFMAGNSVERLIRKIYDSRNFMSAISLYENSTQRVANLRKLLAYASDFERNTNSGLSDFVRYINNIKENKGDLSQANLGASAENAVQIMTIHKSKGLEFPIVFICDLQKKFNMLDLRKELILDINSGIGLKFNDNERMIKYETLMHKSIKEVKRKRFLSEEMRLLYVAMTRAKEKLILTATVDGGYEKFIENVKNSYKFDPNFAKTYLDWLTFSIAENVDCNRITADSEILIEDISFKISAAQFKESESLPQNGEIKEKTIADERIIERIETNLAFKYPHITDTLMPQKFTATQLAKIEFENDEIVKNDESYFFFRNPQFTNKRQYTGKFYGDTYHKLMEMIPFESSFVNSDNTISHFIEGAYSRGKLSDLEKSVLNPMKIYEFFTSEIGKRVLNSNEIHKEFPIFAQLEGFAGASTDQDDIPIVQGIADLFFYENDEIVLVDYKTDRVSDLESLVEIYKEQILAYKMALEKMFLKKVKASYLYSFHKNAEIEII